MFSSFSTVYKFTVHNVLYYFYLDALGLEPPTHAALGDASEVEFQDFQDFREGHGSEGPSSGDGPTEPSDGQPRSSSSTTASSSPSTIIQGINHVCDQYNLVEIFFSHFLHRCRKAACWLCM